MVVVVENVIINIILSINGVTFEPSSAIYVAKGPKYNPTTHNAAIKNPKPANLRALFSTGLTVKSSKFISSGIT